MLAEYGVCFVPTAHVTSILSFWKWFSTHIAQKYVLQDVLFEKYQYQMAVTLKWCIFDTML